MDLDPKGNPVPPSRKNNHHGIAKGFTAWVTSDPAGLQLIKNLWTDATRFDWQQRPEDVLRHLYRDCIPADQRKLFGEHYTPDWLAEMLIKHVLDDEWCTQTLHKAEQALARGNLKLLQGVGVLDPTCGSGTFLFHATRHLVNHHYWQNRKANLTTPQGRQHVANVVSTLIMGIDIHPSIILVSSWPTHAAMAMAVPPA